MYLIIGWVYQDSRPPALSAPKGNSKFEILLAKIFSLKKQNQILPVTIEKIKFLLFSKTVYGSFRQGITIGKCKTKAIHAHSEPCVTLKYLESWYILNPDIFKTRRIFTTLVNLETQYIQNAGIFKI